MELAKRKALVCQMYNNGFSVSEISKELTLGETTIYRYLKSEGIKRNRKYRKYSLDENYFDNIDTEEKAYWLGFIYADGCVNETRRDGKIKSLNLEISLKKSDLTHLEKFTKSININKSKIKSKTTKLGAKTYDVCKIVVGSTEMCRTLIKKGVHPRKSLTLKFPKEDILPNELIRHFIRGYFDGDGNLGVRNTARFKNLARTTFIGTEDFLNKVKNLFEEKLRITCVKLYKNNNSNKVYYYQKSGENAISIIKYMYDGANVYLDRKYEIYKEICRSR